MSEEGGAPRPLEYNEQLERLIAAEGEKAQSFRWLHDRAEKRFSRLNTFITLPVIILSTLSGTASIGSQSLFGESEWAAVGIGLVSILVGILNTVSSFFGWAKRAETHRLMAVSYDKLHRFVSVELALPRGQRLPAKHFLREVRASIDRLKETSPLVPDSIIRAYKAEFKQRPAEVAIPAECNGLHAITVYHTPSLHDRLGALMTRNPVAAAAPDTPRSEAAAA